MTGPPRVLVVGHDSIGSLARSYASGFRAAGASVDAYPYDRAFASVLGPANRRILRRLLERPLVGKFNRRLASDLGSYDVDLVLTVSCRHLLPETIESVRNRTGAKVVNFYPDNPFIGPRMIRPIAGPAVFAAYDACFVPGRDNLKVFERHGARRVHYLPFARDPELHPAVAPVVPPEYDIVFVGNIHRAHRDRARWLAQLADFRLAVHGVRSIDAVPPWSPLRKATLLPPAFGPEFPVALARGAISLNLLHPQAGESHNMRSFESPGCAAFTLSNRTADQLALFAEDEEMVFFDSAQDMRVKVERWLADDEGRARIARQGFRRVEGETYARRATTILDVMLS